MSLFTDENVGGNDQKQAWDLLGPAVGTSFDSGIHDLKAFRIPGPAKAMVSSG